MPETHPSVTPEPKELALTPEEIETAERIINYAKAQKNFVWVYRAEGIKDPQYMHSAGGEVLRGSWFTPNYENARRYAIERNHIPEMKVYALVIPQSLLDQREVMDKGMNQINILSHHLLESKKVVDGPQLSVPTSLDYCSQIALIGKYAEQKKTSIEELLSENT